MAPNPISPDIPFPGPDQARRRRILFRATHRGTHETDILIGGFVRDGLAGFSPGELGELEELMELPDVDLADWLTGRRPIPASCDTPMLRRIRQAAEQTAASAHLAGE
jgi:antitoxin CptB